MKKVLFGLLIVSLLFTSPMIYERIKTESSNNTYEVMVPYTDLAILKSEDVPADEIYKGLKEADVHSITLEPENIRSLETQGVVAVLSKSDIQNYFALTNNLNTSKLPTNEGIFVSFLKENHKSEEYLKRAFQDKITTITANGQKFYFIEGKTNDDPKIEDKSLGYFNTEAYEEIVSNGFQVVPRIKNDFSSDEKEDGHSNNETMVKQLLKFPKNEVDKVLFIGKEVVGYDGKGREKLSKYAKQLKANDYDVVVIEGTEQKGMQTFAKEMNYDVERLYSETRTSEDAASERLARAVKERNIRTFLVKVQKLDDKSAEDEFKQMINEIQDFHAEAPGYFKTGEAQPFKDMKDYKWLQLFAFLGGSVYLALAAASVHKKLTMLALVGGLVLSAGYLLLGVGMLLKGLALLVATAGPIWAVLSVRQAKNIDKIVWNFVMAALIVFAGAWLVVCLLYGDAYLYKLEEFRGIKVLLALPILVTAIVLGLQVNQATSLKKFMSYLNTPVRYWHVVVLGVVAVIGAYYLSRSGNTGTASALELTFRSKLEEIMFVRPRTKEFLIGFPFFVFGLYLFRRYAGIASVFLVVGAIGFASMMNTFTHLHIPLMLSVLRSLYALVIGLMIGLVMIAVYKALKEKLYPYVRERWIQ
ncbi:DUF5693 family protein [Fictibacillus phosphorivorans]|uniref:DUF5693 family protein n=1 Tax=Fictibacillus phosphorivorans TaxID=1221500 RepID=UPI00203F5431|nr:DUF5693 family protein [Fictibacillus phosphorivorans]MCM3718484.1 DUF5693 family protein [Fictibacillus phosphorivorans]MCM3776160.1 DUF5693 family protein [Fictibacillus phosphorivorans]